jgi:hypothetical protein
MRPPFPGMDPWLENPELWPDVHKSLMISIRNALAPLVAPHYFVNVKSRRIILSGGELDVFCRPNVTVGPDGLKSAHSAATATSEAEPYPRVVPLRKAEIEECYLSIRKVPERKEVTTIEVLSPTNKRTKDARQKYQDERRDRMWAGVNLVEIDLLRSGQRVPLNEAKPPTDYCILVYRSSREKQAEVSGFSYREPIPSMRIPLTSGEAEPVLDLNSVLHSLIERAYYYESIDYLQPPQPPLRKDDEPWADSIVARAATEAAPFPARGETAP